LALGILVVSACPAFGQGYSTSITTAYRVTPNITYLTANNFEAKLDVYARSDVTTPQPTMIWIHGGGWTGGNKEGATFSLLPYMEMGWNVVNVEYRLAKISLAPAAVEDCLCALRWIIRNAKQYNFDTSTATDLSLNYELPISKMRLFVQGELVNAFNEQAQIAGDTTVLTRQNGCVQTTGANAGDDCLRFNPIAGDVPVEGIHYTLGSNFGKARNGLDYQLPRTYRFSLGLKF